MILKAIAQNEDRTESNYITTLIRNDMRQRGIYIRKLNKDNNYRDEIIEKILNRESI